MKRILIILSGLLALIYILNPTAGFFEFIPDNIPGVGNLDEGMAAYIIISVISYLTGKEFGLFGAQKKEEEAPRKIEKMPEGDSDS
jgi:uncharacterized membrane protein YkvA (DUF1232 family)